MPTESQRGRSGTANFSRNADIWRIIQIAFRIRRIQIDGCREIGIIDSESRNDGFNGSGGTDAMPGHALGTGNLDFVSMRSECHFQHGGFRRIIQMCGRAVGIVVIDFFGANFRILHCAQKSLGASFPTRARTRDVVRIRRSAIAGKFRIDFCAAGFSVFPFF